MSLELTDDLKHKLLYAMARIVHSCEHVPTMRERFPDPKNAQTDISRRLGNDVPFRALTRRSFGLVLDLLADEEQIQENHSTKGHLDNEHRVDG